MITVRGAVVRLGGAAVLDGVSVDVADGEWLCAVGPNGAGKTTLLRAVAGLVALEGGGVEVGGVPLARLGRRERARRMALVPQAPLVPAGITVGEYVLLGRTPHLPLLGSEGATDRAAAGAALDALDLRIFVGRRLDTLSGGERQRAFLARALAQEPEVLLLDEPTAALDVGHAAEVLELVDRLRHERRLTVVTTMHDLTLAGQYADRLCLLDGGRVVITGRPEEVLTEAHLGRLYGGAVRVVDEGGVLVVVPVRPGVPRAAVPT